MLKFRKLNNKQLTRSLVVAFGMYAIIIALGYDIWPVLWTRLISSF
jgi:hypothetical protein